MKTTLNVALGSVAFLGPILGFSVFRVGAQGRRVESVRSEPYDEPTARVTARTATPPYAESPRRGSRPTSSK